MVEKITDEKETLMTRFFKSLWKIIKWIMFGLGVAIFSLILVQVLIKPKHPFNLESWFYNIFEKVTTPTPLTGMSNPLST